MNKVRRKQIELVKDQLTTLHEQIEMLKDEEEEYADNMPENMQYGSEKHDRATEAVDSLDGAMTAWTVL